MSARRATGSREPERRRTPGVPSRIDDGSASVSAPGRTAAATRTGAKASGAKRSTRAQAGDTKRSSRSSTPSGRGSRSGSAPTERTRQDTGTTAGRDESFRAGRLARSRFGIVYDIDGPRVRLGVIWFLAVLVASAVGVVALGILLGGVAALAGAQTARALRTRWRRPDIATSAFLAAAIPLAAIVGTGLAGVAVVGAAVFSVVMSSIRADRTDPVIDAGAVLRAAVFVGLAAASLVILYRFDVGAVVTLVMMVSAYEVGDYLVGSGATNVVEGPASGVLALVVLTAAVAVIQPPPFVGTGLWVYAGFAAIAAPLGQVVASAILPRAGAPARALRRLDSYLVAGPVWVVLLWGGVGI